MVILTRPSIAVRGVRHARWRPSVLCAYCLTQWGPWAGQAVEPCRVCARPLYLSHLLNPRANPGRVSSVLDTVNALQGIVMIASFTALNLGWISARQLGQAIAMAMFVAASAYTTDGVLGVKSGVVSVFGKLIRGDKAPILSGVKVGVGLVAFALSLLGIVLFGGRR